MDGTSRFCFVVKLTSLTLDRAPLCEYLGKPIPSGPFPNGNAPPEFLGKAGKMMEERKRRALWRMALVGCAFVAGLAVVGVRMYN